MGAEVDRETYREGGRTSVPPVLLEPDSKLYET